MTQAYKKAIDIINEKGVLLVYPVNNRPDPASLWSQFYPKREMTWAWDGDADGRVSRMWILMKKLSESGDVVYSKWYKGRATFFSKKVFTALLALRHHTKGKTEAWPYSSRLLFDVLLADSPISTKLLKKQSDLVGKDMAREFDRSMRFLYENFHVVVFGEVDDGAFPSSAVGATRLLFEREWRESKNLSLKEATAILSPYFPVDSAFGKFLIKSFSPESGSGRGKSLESPVHR